jgi:(2R)-3-sulfolactate dehydrogenase (NADP+)
MSAVTLSLDDLHDLASTILIAHDTSDINADQVADSLVAAEADGQKGHGASRIPSYAAQAKSGKVDGHAVPKLMKVAPAALRVDARSGFAYPALNLAVEALAELASETGIAAATITNSHHSGVAGHHVEPLARRPGAATADCSEPTRLPSPHRAAGRSRWSST